MRLYSRGFSISEGSIITLSPKQSDPNSKLRANVKFDWGLIRSVQDDLIKNISWEISADNLSNTEKRNSVEFIFQEKRISVVDKKPIVECIIPFAIQANSIVEVLIPVHRYETDMNTENPNFEVLVLFLFS